MERFEIIIKDLKEGTTCIHERTNCIIGAIANKDKESAQAIVFTNCNGAVIRGTISIVENLIAQLKLQIIEEKLPKELVNLLKQLIKED